MRVLITGAGGFVGTHLKKFLEKDHSVLATSRHIGDGIAESLDLISDRSVDEFLDAHKDDGIDAIVHAAARLVSAGMSYDEQFSVFEDNIRMTRNVIRIAKELGVGTIVNFSSIAVYPNEDGTYDETSEIRMSGNAEFFYGLSKFASENMIDNALSETVRIVHLRMAQVYGDGMRTDRIIPMMIESVRRDNKIEVYGDGERISCFIPVEKACEAAVFALVDTSLSGIYNVGDKNMSYLQLAEEICKRYGDGNTKIVKISSGKRSQFFLDTGKWDRYLKKRKES
ncbi:MAG: NAD(P)-dependent oxidoreductase [Lachnospiraceae bacterium]|nr:NAD(P)-dependent oxidoreductase [Lachnospiraceae bacterium]